MVQILNKIVHNSMHINRFLFLSSDDYKYETKLFHKNDKIKIVVFFVFCFDISEFDYYVIHVNISIIEYFE